MTAVPRYLPDDGSQASTWLPLTLELAKDRPHARRGDRLKRNGVPVDDDWLRRIGTAHFSYINFRGTMRFGVEKVAAALIQRTAGQALGWPREACSGTPGTGDGDTPVSAEC